MPLIESDWSRDLDGSEWVYFYVDEKNGSVTFVADRKAFYVRNGIVGLLVPFSPESHIALEKQP